MTRVVNRYMTFRVTGLSPLWQQGIDLGGTRLLTLGRLWKWDCRRAVRNLRPPIYTGSQLGVVPVISRTDSAPVGRSGLARLPALSALGFSLTQSKESEYVVSYFRKK